MELKNVIGKALVDVSRTDLILKEEEIKLGNRDCDLIKSVKVILFLLQNLREHNTNIGQILFIVVSEGINERRNCNIVNLLCYLDNLDEYKSDSELPDNLLKYPNKNEIAKTASANITT